MSGRGVSGRGVSRHLQREGRLDEATEFRRQICRQQRAQGKTKAEAGEAAWTAMMEKFPPQDGWESERALVSPGQAFEELKRRTDGQPVDFPRDVLWVYQHLADREVTPDNAPSTGSWSLLGWARNYRNHFFQNMFPKALAAQGKAKPHDEEEMVQTEQKSVEELTEALKPFTDEVQVVCPRCGADLNEATWKKHLEARKVAEQRSRERFGDG